MTENNDTATKKENKVSTSVSFSRDCNEEININDCNENTLADEDDIQISLAPYIQVYLAHSSQEVHCCGLSFPIPFERAAARSWWDPRFDSEILEDQYKLSAFPQIRLRFRYSLMYVFVVSIFWCLYLTIKAIHDEGKTDSLLVALIFGSFSIFTLFILLFTKSNLYTKYHFAVSAMTAIVMFALSLISVGTVSILTPVGDFSLCIEILMIIYTVTPLPLYVCVLLGVFYSFLFEFFISSVFFMPERLFCHVCVHLIGIHILVMTNVRMRGTFMKVGQSLLVRRQLEMEKQLKEKMILSVMPPKVADWLMSGGKEDETQSSNNDIRSIFRPFNMHRMENVSILFADIVGFTQMSSKKSAEQLVTILNDLFERFDELCLASGCEKISTLGDCYYCVSGCPEPRPDHAHCCVQMGLGMIQAIGQFERESKEGVNMRVGIHTGTVLCGIVGTKRVKFDVWSNDVTLANKMESTGKPGLVHLSAKTKEYLDDRYILTEGDPYKGMQTYFVKEERNHEKSKSNMLMASTQCRRSSVSLAAAISMHINQTAGLEEALSSTPPTRTLHTTSMPSILDTQHAANHTTHSKWIYKQVPTFNALELDDTALKNVSRNPLSKTPAGVTREDQKSICPSMNSRKDSGIRSNSRKSSILLPSHRGQSSDLMHRVSGYYTSSQSSMNNEETLKSGRLINNLVGDEYGVCFQKLRKQSDIQLIKCVQDNSVSQRSYFVKPPLHNVSLFFRQKDMEREYRLKAHRSVDDEASTLAAARFNTHLDIAVAILVFLLSFVSCLLLFGLPSRLLPYLILLGVVQTFALLLCLRSVFWPNITSGLDRCSDWLSWHLLGGVLVSLPIIVILLFFNDAVKNVNGIYYFSSLFFIGIMHFCNFTQLNCWMKSSVATLAGIVFLVLTTNYLHTADGSVIRHNNHTNSFLAIDSLQKLNSLNDISFQAPKGFQPKHNNGSDNLRVNSQNNLDTMLVNPFLFDNKSLENLHTNTTILRSAWDSSCFQYEIYLDVFLILLLVWFLNREFEISYRLSFHGNIVAARDKAKMQMMKDQAELLLHNIIPKHVAEHLKTTVKYSENVKSAGIIFASIINFSEMYDESYLGGLECLRVLNELVSDFDEVLGQPEFECLEKIKTIGSTYMVASGLNLSQCKQHHLHTLMDFALQLLSAVDSFNRDLLSFNLILRIGYCYGDITAGVIGTSKLYYDIWGDAVNIASRMESTGVAGHIQLPSHCVPALEDRFMFQPRGPVYVKGKDNMQVHLVVGKL